MKHISHRLQLVLLCCALLGSHAAGRAQTNAATGGFVATGHPLATQAGLDALRSGGNAVDAAVAIGLTLGVVDGANSGIGGGCFLLLRLADGRVVAIDGRETAPAAATRDMFVRDGQGDARLSQTGPLASGTPGALAAYEYARKEHGRKPLRELILPAADLAARGFKLDQRYAARVKEVAPELELFPASRAIFLDAHGKPWPAGARFQQRDLAATYRAIAELGTDWFYRGPFAGQTGRWMRQHGGLLTEQDFHDYTVKLRQPVRSTYRQWTVIGFPPPSSGGVHIAQMLNILETFDLKARVPTERLHLMAEAMKAAFADRAWWLGDPDFAKVPVGLLDKGYAKELAARIRPDRALPVAGHGAPPGWATNCFERHTTHFSVADAEGNWVACTATVNTTLGSKVVIPGTGVVLNNEMDDFSIQPGVTNYFGLIGAEANAVAPGKRPLSSMSPTLVLQDGEPIAALGAAGGPKIITATLQNLVNLLDLNLAPKAALAAPRIHQQWSPDELLVEKQMLAATRAELIRLGHRVKELSPLGVAQIVTRPSGSRQLDGAADPRSGGTAAGVAPAPQR